MLKIRDIMTRDVVTLSPEASLREAAELFASRHLSGAPVVAGEKVVGVLSTSDILDFEASTPAVPSERTDQAEWGASLEEAPQSEPDSEPEDEPSASYFSELWSDVGADATERFTTVASPEWDRLAEHTVDEAMSRNVRSLGPNVDTIAAADLMTRMKIHRVLVLEEGKLLGIVTAMDIARAAADQRLVTRRYVFDRRGGEEGREGEF